VRVKNSRMDEHKLLAIYLPELFLEEKLSNEYVVKIYEKAMSYSYTFASYFDATSLFHTKCDNTGESKLKSKAMQKSEGVDWPEDEMLNYMCEQKEAATERVQTSEGDTKGTCTWRGTRAVGANEDCEIRVVSHNTAKAQSGDKAARECKKSAVAGSTAKAQSGDKATRECAKSAVKASTAKARRGDDAAKACKRQEVCRRHGCDNVEQSGEVKECDKAAWESCGKFVQKSQNEGAARTDACERQVKELNGDRESGVKGEVTTHLRHQLFPPTHHILKMHQYGPNSGSEGEMCLVKNEHGRSKVGPMQMKKRVHLKNGVMQKNKGHEMRAAAKARACVWQEDRKWRAAVNEQKNCKWRDMRAAANEQKNCKWHDMRAAATSKTETKQKKAPRKEPRANTGSEEEECTMEVHVISHAEPNTYAQSAAEKKEDLCEKRVSKGDGKERKRESGAKGEVTTHLRYQFFDYKINTTKEILVSEGDMRRSRVPKGDTLHQNRPNSGSKGEECPATEHSRSKVGHVSKEISTKEFLDENEEQGQANTENTKQKKHQKKQNIAEKNLFSMKNVRRTIEAITMVMLAIQKVFEWCIPAINTSTANANAQGRSLLKQEKKMQKLAIETQNNVPIKQSLGLGEPMELHEEAKEDCAKSAGVDNTAKDRHGDEAAKTCVRQVVCQTCVEKHDEKVESKEICGDDEAAWEDRIMHGKHVAVRVCERQTFVIKIQQIKVEDHLDKRGRLHRDATEIIIKVLLTVWGLIKWCCENVANISKRGSSPFICEDKAARRSEPRCEEETDKNVVNTSCGSSAVRTAKSTTGMTYKEKKPEAEQEEGHENAREVETEESEKFCEKTKEIYLVNFEKQHVAAAREDEEIKLAGQDAGEMECADERTTEALDEPKITCHQSIQDEGVEPTTAAAPRKPEKAREQ